MSYLIFWRRNFSFQVLVLDFDNTLYLPLPFIAKQTSNCNEVTGTSVLWAMKVGLGVGKSKLPSHRNECSLGGIVTRGKVHWIPPEERKTINQWQKEKSCTNSVCNEAVTFLGGTKRIQRTSARRYSLLTPPTTPCLTVDAPEIHKPVFLLFSSMLDLVVVKLCLFIHCFSKYLLNI